MLGAVRTVPIVQMAVAAAVGQVGRMVVVVEAGMVARYPEAARMERL